MTVSIEKATTFPVVEIFGPTVQGEGALAGLTTMFVRFGYCDYRCWWCDSMFAVEPSQVKENAGQFTANEINLSLQSKAWAPGMWVTLSGGNPAIHDLADLVRLLQGDHYKVAVETQGSVYRSWLKTVDHLVVSPKPPSSGMVNDRHAAKTAQFLARIGAQMSRKNRSMKIVVFDDDDYEWAAAMVAKYGFMWDTFLSVGTPPITAWDAAWKHATSDEEVRRQIGERYRWLCEKVAGDRVMVATRVLPQLHVIAWGHSRGV